MKRIDLPNYVLRTGSRFESTDRFRKKTTVVNSAEDSLRSAGVPLAQLDDDIYATSNEEYHCFVIGDSGCGKSRRVIMPTIRLLSKTGESMVISDPKGEIYKETSSSLEKKGYNVQVLNFRNPSRGMRLNPLGVIESLYHTGNMELMDKAIHMLMDIIDVLKQEIKSSDAFWSSSAGQVMLGVSLIILNYGEPGDLTFENIVSVAREIYKEINDSERRGNNCITDSKGKFAKLMNEIPVYSPIKNNLSVLITNADSTRNCIMAEFETMVSLYVSQESLMDLFAVSEIDIEALGKQPTALFIILPDDNKSLYPIATIIIQHIYSILVSLADEQPDGKLVNRVTFLLDEFANFAKIPSMDSMLTASRSRRIRFVLVCQAMEQLAEKYNESGMETILSNCRVWIYMSCRNLPFLERLEKLLGNYRGSYTGEQAPLLTIREMQEFEMGHVLVLNDRCHPMMGFLPDYSKYNFGADGPGTIVELPEPHERLDRKKFTLSDAVKNAKNRMVKTDVDSGDTATYEDDYLRRAIFAKISEVQNKLNDDNE